MLFVGAPLRIFPHPLSTSALPTTKRLNYSKKRSTTWVGFKVHLTESCEPHLPLLITHVETTSAPVSDDAMQDTRHWGLVCLTSAASRFEPAAGTRCSPRFQALPCLAWLVSAYTAGHRAAAHGCC